MKYGDKGLAARAWLLHRGWEEVPVYLGESVYRKGPETGFRLEHAVQYEMEAEIESKINKEREVDHA